MIDPEDYYIFEILKFDFIDFDNTMILCDGTISIALNIDKIPQLDLKTDDDVLGRIDRDDDYSLIFNLADGEVVSLDITRQAIRHFYECIYPITLDKMEFVDDPKFHYYKEIFDKFNTRVMNWATDRIKAQMRTLVEKANPKGIFKNDDIDINENTYYQSRDDDGVEIYYIIYRWWDKIVNGKANFVDVVNGKGTIFIARN